jgi:hypothetical protein
VLEVGHRGRRPAEHGRVERATPRGEQREGDEPAADLEAAIRDVVMRYAVTRDMQRRAQEQGKRPRPDERTDGTAGGHVQRDDQAPIIAYAPRAMSVSDWFRRLFSPSPAPASPEDDAIMREEYGERATEPMGPGGIAGGVAGFAGLEDAEAAEDAVEGDEPSRPAP